MIIKPKLDKQRKFSLFAKRKNEPTTSELVFRILSRKFPLTVGALHTEFRETYKQKLSYQAVRKAVVALQSQGVVEHGKQGYQLSSDWLLKVRSLADSTLARYRHSRGQALANHDGHQVFIADSLYEVDTLWGEIVLSLCRNFRGQGEKKVICINRHPWWIQMNVGHEMKYCEALDALGFSLAYIFTIDSANVHWVADYYEHLGVKVSVHKDCSIPASHYYNVIGDFVIEGVLPSTLERRIEELFGHGKRFKNIQPNAITKLAQQRAEIRVSVQRNKTFAMGLLSSVGLDTKHLKR